MLIAEEVCMYPSACSRKEMIHWFLIGPDVVGRVHITTQDPWTIQKSETHTASASSGPYRAM